MENRGWKGVDDQRNPLRKRDIEMTEGWKEYRLGNLTDWASGKTPSKQDESLWNGNIPWISAKLMPINKVADSEVKITERGLKIGSKLAEENDILLLVRGSGLFNDIPICWVEGPVAFNQDIKSIRAKRSTNQKFIYYWLKGHKKELYDILEETGIGAGKFDTELLKKLPIAIPNSDDERDRIVRLPEALFDKIDLLHSQNKTLEQLAETLFRQWFIEEAKEDWEWHQIGEFVEVMRGLSYNGAGLSEKGNGVPMHNLNSVYEGGGYKYDGIKYYKGDYKDRHLVSSGDVIVTNTEQGHEMLLIGYPAIVPKYFGSNGIFTQHVYKLRIIETVTEPFVYHLLKTWDVREQIAGATNGSTVNMLPKDGIEWAKFKLPPVELINRFTETVRPMIAKQETNYEQIQKLTSLRDTLLPKLMSGEVRVEIE